MRSWCFAMALALLACGGTKKSSSTPTSGSETEETENGSDDTSDRDQARPDNEDDMPSKAMGDPCNE